METDLHDQVTSGETPRDCICGRGDWVYDAEVGMWCCGCGYVKHASGKHFISRKKGGWGDYKLDKRGKIIQLKPEERF